MTLAEIAEKSATPPRTIRFYISRGLLPGPAKGGRGAAYTAEHLALLSRIQRLQSEGRTLADIARTLSPASGRPGVPAPTAWWQHAVADDVLVWVSAGVGPWRSKQVRAALEEFARRVGPASQETRKEQGDT